MGQRGFGNLAPGDILARLVELYGRPSLTELKKGLQRLHDPMDRRAPVKVILCDIEEIQMFLLADRNEDRRLKQS